MIVLSFNPSDDLFFVGVTWEEYRRLAKKYKIDMVDMEAEEVIEMCQKFWKEEKIGETEEFSYLQYIRDLYHVHEVPNICLVIERDLSFLAVQQYDYPFGHMWNAYSPWERVKPVEIDSLDDLAAMMREERR